ncbi:MAG: hypothetical protein IT165_06350 [Bryobacterales bacterium]|nr:hypothetical protein [Bryobacterales bacterium]
MSAQPAVVSTSTPAQGHLFVSTALDTWLTEDSAAFARDVQINDTVYRRLDPEYYAWLRSRMMLAKTAACAGHIGIDAFHGLRRGFNAVHHWAVDRFDEQALVAATNALDVREYKPPAAEQEPQPRAVMPASLDRNAVVVSPESAALVDAIRDGAIALGWTYESLYQTRGATRFPLGDDYGLVCYLKPGDRIGEVTTYSIEIIRPNNVCQRFYSPNVDQPWIKHVACKES